MQWPNTERGPSEARPRIHVDIAFRLGKECGDPRDFRLVLVGVSLHIAVGNSRASAPAASSCACVEVTAKRGVIA